MNSSWPMTETITSGDDYDLHRPLAIIHSDGRRVDTALSASLSSGTFGQKQDFEEDQDNEYRLIDASRFNLPDGWIVTEVPRKTGDRIDRYFYEPGTGHQFRSLPSVRKHLAELEEDNLPLSVVLEEIKELRENNLPLSKAFKLVTPMKDCGPNDSSKKSVSSKEQDLSFSNVPPNKINWVIPKTRGDTWNAFVGDELVPDSMKQQWRNRFMLTINDTKQNQ